MLFAAEGFGWGRLGSVLCEKCLGQLTGDASEILGRKL